jgi:hypothetical protein
MQSVEDLIEPIKDATNAGDLEWKTDGRTFTATLGDYKIVTWQWTDEHDGSSGISIGLREAKFEGEVLDTIVAGEYSTRYDRATDFFSMARRSALDVDNIVSALKRDLKALRSK